MSSLGAPTPPSTRQRIITSARKREQLMEANLYPPVKRFLERLGFEVKGEICGCDLVAIKDGAPAAMIIGELK